MRKEKKTLRDHWNKLNFRFESTHWFWYFSERRKKFHKDVVDESINGNISKKNFQRLSHYNFFLSL